MSILTDDQRQVQEWAREFARREIAPRALVLDEDPESPEREALLRAAARAGILGSNLPEFLGGAGHDPVTGALITEELAAECAGCAVLFGANMLGLLPILLSGNLGAIERFVRPIAQSWETDRPKLAALAATEPDAGSDFIMGHPGGRMRTRVDKKDGGYVINGRKNFITNGTLCDYCRMAAYTDRPKRGEGISVFIVDRDTPGFEVTRKLEKMGHRSSDTAELVFEDCEVPEEALLGGKEGAFGALMGALITGRVSHGVKSAAIAEAAFEAARQYATEREAFGRSLSKFQAISFKLSDMATRIEAAKALAYKAAWLYSTGQPCVKEASMAKYFSAEVADYVCREAVQIHGGYGYIVEYPVERYYRDAKLASITEGTSEIQQLIISKAIGL